MKWAAILSLLHLPFSFLLIPVLLLNRFLSFSSQKEVEKRETFGFSVSEKKLAHFKPVWLSCMSLFLPETSLQVKEKRPKRIWRSRRRRRRCMREKTTSFDLSRHLFLSQVSSSCCPHLFLHTFIVYHYKQLNGINPTPEEGGRHEDDRSLETSAKKEKRKKMMERERNYSYFFSGWPHDACFWNQKSWKSKQFLWRNIIQGSLSSYAKKITKSYSIFIFIDIMMKKD